MSNLKQAVLTGLLAVSLTMTGCAKGGGSAASGEKVATIDGIAISKVEYDKLYDQVVDAYGLGENEEALKNPLLQESIKRMVMQKLIMTAFLESDAKKMGLQVTPEELKTFRDEKVKEFGSKEMFDKFLAEGNITAEEFDEKAKEQILMNKFLEKKGGDEIKVSDKEAQEYYDSHKTEFQVPEAIRANHILIKAMDAELKRDIRKENPKFTEDQVNTALKEQKAKLRAKANDLLTQVKNNPSQFASLANKNSDDVVSARNGGDLDQLFEENTEKTFWSAIKKTKPGSLYPDVLETPFGYHVIYVRDHAKPHTLSFQEAKARIVEQLVQDKKMALLNTWAQDKMAAMSPEDIEPDYRPKEPTETTGEGGEAPAQQEPQASAKDATQKN